MANYYDPDFDAETKLGLREEFIRALSDIPEWAIHRAFDTWAKTKKRRPCPAEIIELAQDEIAPFHSEVKRRAAAAQPVEEKRERITPERAAELMREVFGSDRAADSVGAAKKMPHHLTEAAE